MHEGKRFVTERKTLFVRGAALVLPLICALLLLSQTVFAENTYLITDGSRVLVHTTFATDPAAVLDEAGFELGEEDTYTTQNSNGISEITVQRGQTGETVDAVYTLETYTQSIAYETTYCSDTSIPIGTRKVLTAGEDGEMSCTASVVYQDGEELSRTVLSQTVIRQPVNAVIAVGAGLAASDGPADAPVIGDGVIITPTGEVLTYTKVIHSLATAYTCNGYVGTTATGTVAREGEIAVDPKVIPYGTRMYIVTDDGEIIYGVATAEDCGHPDFICGNRIDLYYDSLEECYQFGARYCSVYILG